MKKLQKNDIQTERFRDLVLINFLGQTLVIATDAAGGIGPNELDVEKTTGESVAYFSTRVVLAELYSVRVLPLVLISMISTGREFTDKEALLGIKRQLKEEHLLDQVMIGGSSENNFCMSQTAIGVTMIGLSLFSKVPPHNIVAGDLAYQVGLCKKGKDVHFQDPTRIKLGTIICLAKESWVHEVIPLGSKGVLGEVDELSKRGLGVLFNKKVEPNELSKSAGPATSALVIIDKSCAKNLETFCSEPYYNLGKIILV